MPRIPGPAAALALFVVLGCACAPSRPLVIAHRGASGLAPEHTLAAYDLAIELGSDYIEQDLHFTRDGVLVILHDTTLDRTARGPGEWCTGLVELQDLSALERCDFGAWFEPGADGAGGPFAGERIVTLDALFARYGRSVRYYIETKQPDETPGLEEALLALLSAHDLLPRRDDPNRVIVQSFHPESLRRMRELEVGLPLMQLVERDVDRPLDDALAAVAAYADGVAPHRSQVDEAFLAAARRHGLVVHSYTVNEPDEMTRLLDLGVDGLFTDRPDLLIELLRTR